MKRLVHGLQAHLDSGATTLAWCWRLTRRDESRLGFTDHDRDIDFDGTTFEAAAGMTASDIKDSVGLSVDNLTIESALNSDHLSERDLAAGLYDDARIEIWRVNWSEPAQRVLMRSGSLGEVRRSGLSFSAEVRGLAHYLQQPQGRLYQYACDATLGDQRCGIDLTDVLYRAVATISVAQSRRRFEITYVGNYSTDWFTRGLARFGSGANQGASIEIKRHIASIAAISIELWQPLVDLPAVGDVLTLTAGCDKTFATCGARFQNRVNFRGFPHMPGNDFVMTVAKPGDPANDGSPLSL